MLNKMSKEHIHAINVIARDNLEKAETMLDAINMVLGTEYFILCARVCYTDDDFIHDAWANAEDK